MINFKFEEGAVPYVRWGHETYKIQSMGPIPKSTPLALRYILGDCAANTPILNLAENLIGENIPVFNNYSTNARRIADGAQNTESAIVSSCPTSEPRNNCFIKCQTLDKNISNYIFYRPQVFGHFEGKFSVIKLSV